MVNLNVGSIPAGNAIYYSATTYNVRMLGSVAVSENKSERVH
jgi:hypothetical protein